MAAVATTNELGEAVERTYDAEGRVLSESGDERYIVDLILKVVTVSMETQSIVSNLTKLEF